MGWLRPMHMQLYAHCFPLCGTRRRRMGVEREMHCLPRCRQQKMAQCLSTWRWHTGTRCRAQAAHQQQPLNPHRRPELTPAMKGTPQLARSQKQTLTHIVLFASNVLGNVWYGRGLLALTQGGWKKDRQSSRLELMSATWCIS
jgi:hypothetical protein